MLLYDYFNISSSYRVRIALYMKGISFEIEHIDLLKGEHKQDSYITKNPQGVVPLLVDNKGYVLSQSLAIIEYLDEIYPAPPLLYGSAQDKAYVRQMALIVACDIHPLNNPKVWKAYVGGILGANDDQLAKWYDHWILEGLSSYETMLSKAQKSGQYTLGDKVSLADLFLIPQLYNARRFNVSLERFPLIRNIEKNCVQLDAFIKAAPESQKDAPSDLEPIHGLNAPFIKEAA